MGNLLLLAALGINNFWYALPLVVAVSLVYSATRHEEMRPILIHAGRVALWIAGVGIVLFAVLSVISWRT